MEAGINGGLVAGFAGGSNAKGLVQERQGAARALIRVFLLQGIRQFQKGLQAACLGNYKVP